MNTVRANPDFAESSSPDAHPFRSGRGAPRSNGGPQAQLDDLARAGVVTHVVGHGEEIDTLFAVSQLRDLPEVRFVAAFREGFIALGCPDGLPEQLKDLASPISVPPEPEKTEDVGADKMQSTLDAVLGRLSALEGPDGLAAVHEKLQTLDTVNVETARMVGDLAHTIAEGRVPDPAQTIEAQLEGPLRALMSGQDALAERITRPLADIAERLGHVEQQIEAVRADANQAPTGPTQVVLPPDLEHLIDVLPHLNAGLTRVEEGLSAAVHHGNERLDGVLTRLDEMSAAVIHPPQSDARIGQIAETLDGVGLQLDALKQEMTQHAAPPAASAHDSTAERTAILSALAQVQDSIENVAARPDPVLDLTAQRQSFAQFSTVMKMVVQRLEGTADHIKEALDATRDPDRQAIPEALYDDLREIVSSTLSTSLAKSDDSPRIGEELDSIKTQMMLLPTVAQQIEDANTTLQAIANKPKPVLDLTEQRRSFASFTTALATVVQRLEEVAERHATPAEVESTENSILEKIERLPEQCATHISSTFDTEAIAAQLTERLQDNGRTEKLHAEILALPDRIVSAAPPTDLSTIESSLSALSQQQCDLLPTLDRLQTQVEVMQTTAPVTLDLTEQRTSFAMFGTALATVVGRLELMIETMGRTAPAADGAELGQLIQGLSEALTAFNPDLSNIENQIERLAPLTDLPQQISGLQSTFENQISQQQPPRLDLTEQRQSLARFATAAEQVIRRMEAVSSALPDQIAARDAANYRPLAKRMRRLERQIAALRSAQEGAASQMQHLTRTLEDDPAPLNRNGNPNTTEEAAASEIEELVSPQADALSMEDTASFFQAADAPLDNLRFYFAEMIASQIRETLRHGAAKPKV